MSENELEMKTAKKLFKEEPAEYLFKVFEEFSELQMTLLHYKHGKANLKEVLEELADVTIQMRKIFFYLANFDDEKYLGVKFIFENELTKKNKKFKKLISLDY